MPVLSTTRPLADVCLLTNELPSKQTGVEGLEKKMAHTTKTRIGWLGPSLPSASHIKKFQNLVPAEVEVVYEQLKLHDGVLNDVQGKLDLIVNRAVEFTERDDLNGLIFPGAPREVLNPGLFAGFSSTLKIPVATALQIGRASCRERAADC